ncbi:hypothetical protein CAP48_12970 [Advenella sp. S44]|nr:hypothetical protein CAP48_12970 [Advenella sp. S44]
MNIAYCVEDRIYRLARVWRGGFAGGFSAGPSMPGGFATGHTGAKAIHWTAPGGSGVPAILKAMYKKKI